MIKQDIHDNKRALELAIIRLKKNKEISEKNKRLLLRFKDYILSQGLSKCRGVFYLNRLTNTAKWLKKNFDKANKEDIRKLVSFIEQREDYSVNTKYDYKVAIRYFFRWLKFGDEKKEYPDEVKWIKTSIKKCNAILPKNLLTIDDIKKLVQVADNFRDKALIMVLYESGCRIGELLNLRISDLEFNKYGVKINFFGKTGHRKILLINSVPHLNNWINSHPENNNPEAFLWLLNGEDIKKIYTTVKSKLKYYAKKINLNKHINPHHFRHSRATFLAKIFTEAQLCQYFGWVLGSDMPRIYVHLSGRDIDNAILKMNNMIEEKKENKEELTTKKCPKCNTNNSFEVKYCVYCGLALDDKYGLNIIQKEKELVNKIPKNAIEKLIQKEVERKIKEIYVHLSGRDTDNAILKMKGVS